jgi:hypothetical protein
MEDDIADKLDRIQENFFKLEEATKKIINMSTPIRISNDMINAAKIHADLESRSLTKQIEHWAKIGKIAEENPDLNYGFIKDILLSKLEIDNNEVEEYVGLSCKS